MEIDLPQGWKKVKLGQVCKSILGGGTPSTKVPEYWTGTIPWISSADIHGLKDITPRKMVSMDAIKNSAAAILPKGGIIVVTRVGLGKICIAPFDIAFSQDNQGLILNEDLITQSYALLCLSQGVQLFKHQSRGTTINGVTKKQLVELQIPLPPIDEQHQIVEKIEELFSELDKGIENLKIAQQQLKVYRQAVLKWAFEGKLTNENIKDGELPEGWEIQQLNGVCKIISGFAFKSSDFSNSGIPIIKIANIGYSEFHWKDQQFVSENFWDSNINYRIFSDDLLIALTRPITNNTTKVCKYPKNTKPGLLNQRVACMKDIKINKDFLYCYFQTSNFKNHIRKNFSETLQPNLSPKDLALTPIPVCSINEQELVVQAIESRLSVCDKMEETIANSLQQAEALRQSILKRAFEGKLIPELAN